MNQTPASILVLASSVFGFAATQDTSSSNIYALVAFAIGFVGAIAMFVAIVRERELFIDNHARLDVFDRFFQREPNSVRPKTRQQVVNQNVEIPAELQAQINIVAEMEGRERTEVLEEALRRHLPKYSKARVA